MNSSEYFIVTKFRDAVIAFLSHTLNASDYKDKIFSVFDLQREMADKKELVYTDLKNPVWGITGALYSDADEFCGEINCEHVHSIPLVTEAVLRKFAEEHLEKLNQFLEKEPNQRN